jgi:hypothetical protein
MKIIMYKDFVWVLNNIGFNLVMMKLYEYLLQKAYCLALFPKDS